MLDDFYKEIDSTQQIEINPAGATWPIVSGQVELAAKIFAGGGTVSGVTYSVDNVTADNMTLTAGAKWVTAKASWNTASLSQGYHEITVAATGSAGSSQIVEQVKVSADPTQPITAKDLQEHLRVYQGHYVTVQGTVEMAMFNTVVRPAGGRRCRDRGLYRQGSDLRRGMLQSSSPHCCPEQHIKVKVIPMRFTWAFMTSAEDREGTFDMFALQESMVPSRTERRFGCHQGGQVVHETGDCKRHTRCSSSRLIFG